MLNEKKALDCHIDIRQDQNIFLFSQFYLKSGYMLKKFATMESTPLQSKTMPVTWTMQAVTEAHYVNSTSVHVQNTISRALKKLAIQLTLWSVSSVLNVFFCRPDRRKQLHRTNHSLSQKVHRKMIPLYSDTFCCRIPYYIHLCRQLLFNSLFFNNLRAPNFFRNYIQRLPIWPLFEILRNVYKLLLFFQTIHLSSKTGQLKNTIFGPSRIINEVNRDR